MRKGTTFIIALAIILAVLLYKMPVEVKRELQGRTFSSINTNTDKTISIVISGKLQRNLFSEDSFAGFIVIDGKSMYVKTPVPANLSIRIKSIGDKLGGLPIFATETDTESGYVKTIGQVMLSREFDMIWGYSNVMRAEYNDSEITFAGASDKQMTAIEVMKKLSSE